MFTKYITGNVSEQAELSYTQHIVTSTNETDAFVDLANHTMDFLELLPRPCEDLPRISSSSNCLGARGSVKLV